MKEPSELPPRPPAEADERWQASVVTLGSRSSYKQVWDRQAQDADMAALAVAGYADETALEAAARDTLQVLSDTVGYGPHDIVLEIGCGIGRVGKALSPLCLHWIGTDISGAMLQHTARRLAGCDNVTLIELDGIGLREIPDHSIDLVYCTVVFMHLYEWDRYRYVQEAFRVLRPGGRCYFDNMDIASPQGWRMFEAGMKYPPEQRPAHLSSVSTGEELSAYAHRAGFGDVRIHRLPQGWVALAARKPDLPPEDGGRGFARKGADA